MESFDSLGRLLESFAFWKSKEEYVLIMQRYVSCDIDGFEFQERFFSNFYSDSNTYSSIQEVLATIEDQDQKLSEFEGLGTLLEKLTELDNSGTLVKKLTELEGARTLAEKFTELEGFSPLLEKLNQLYCFLDLLHGLCYDCENFVGNPALRDENDISDQDMRDLIKKHLLYINDRCL